VWTYLDVWLVQTGEIPQLAVGDTLEALAVRAMWSTIDPTEMDEGVSETSASALPGEDAPRHLLVGTVTWRRPPRVLAVRVGSFEVLAEPCVGGAEARLPEVGQRVAMDVSAYAVPDYEIEADDLPDVRRDWSVRGLRVEHRELVSSAAHPGSSEPGRVLKVVQIPHMLRWADAPRGTHAGYLLDLAPAR
jgi:hypothetical protein